MKVYPSAKGIPLEGVGFQDRASNCLRVASPSTRGNKNNLEGHFFEISIHLNISLSTGHLSCSFNNLFKPIRIDLLVCGLKM